MFFTKTENGQDQDQLQDAWGNRHANVSDFQHAWDGDHLLVPFECDQCMFIKLKGRVHQEGNGEDILLA
jgi:hypothetical protein